MSFTSQGGHALQYFSGIPLHGDPCTPENDCVNHNKLFSIVASAKSPIGRINTNAPPVIKRMLFEDTEVPFSTVKRIGRMR